MDGREKANRKAECSKSEKRKQYHAIDGKNLTSILKIRGFKATESYRNGVKDRKVATAWLKLQICQK